MCEGPSVIDIRFEFAGSVADEGSVQSHGTRWVFAGTGTTAPGLLSHLWDPHSTGLSALLQAFWGLL